MLLFETDKNTAGTSGQAISHEGSPAKGIVKIIIKMIHISTIHYKSDKWINIQLEYLKRHIKEPFKVYAVLNGIGRKYFRKFFFATDYQDRVNNFDELIDHRNKLNFLAKHIIKNTPDEDILIFLDGDAFPIARLDLFLNDKLRHYEIVAIPGSGRTPHPSFYATKVKTWKNIKGRWGISKKWLEEIKNKHNAATDNLLVRVIKEDTAWHRLLRTNNKDLHQPLSGRPPFSIYGNLIYHHRGSFRENLVSPKPNIISRLFLHLPALKFSAYFIRKLIKILREKKNINRNLLNNLEKSNPLLQSI